jgi:hypothetical protein
LLAAADFLREYSPFPKGITVGLGRLWPAQPTVSFGEVFLLPGGNLGGLERTRSSPPSRLLAVLEDPCDLIGTATGGMAGHGTNHGSGPCAAPISRHPHVRPKLASLSGQADIAGRTRNVNEATSDRGNFGRRLPAALPRRRTGSTGIRGVTGPDWCRRRWASHHGVTAPTWTISSSVHITDTARK